VKQERGHPSRDENTHAVGKFVQLLTNNSLYIVTTVQKRQHSFYRKVKPKKFSGDGAVTWALVSTLNGDIDELRSVRVHPRCCMPSKPTATGTSRAKYIRQSAHAHGGGRRCSDDVMRRAWYNMAGLARGQCSRSARQGTGHGSR